MRRIGTLVLLGLLSGCGVGHETVQVYYSPPTNQDVVDGAKSVSISVIGKDGRKSDRDRISTIRNGYGRPTSIVSSGNDVVELVRSAVERELRLLGFKNAPGGIAVNVELRTFLITFDLHLFTADAKGEVVFDLTAIDASGGRVYSRRYRGTGFQGGVVPLTGELSKPALQYALTNAVAEMVRDNSLRQALVAVGRK